MPSRCWSFLAAFALLVSAPCHADRFYRLVDYPANQNGHFLNGTITTSDAAPIDSLLDVSEILSWHWSITGPFNYSASNQQFTDDATLATGVQITPQAIFLTQATPADPTMRELVLSRITGLGSRGNLGHNLRWRTGHHLQAGQFDLYTASQLQGDVARNYWFDTQLNLSSLVWTIAIAVPEPATGLLLTACATACVLRRRPSTFSRG